MPPIENDYMRRVREQQAKAAKEEANPFRKVLNFLPGGSIIDKATREAGPAITGADVATEAALSLVPFGLGKVFRGIKGAKKGADILGGPQPAARPGMLQRMGQGLEERGQRLLGTQANLTRAEGRKIGALPSDVLGSINRRTGLTNIDDMASVARNVTGREGAFSELTRNAVGNIPGVDVGDLRRVGEDILANKAPLITGQAKKQLLDTFKNTGVTVRGGAAGSLSPLANPLDALDASRNFRQIADDIRKGATVSAADKQLASVYGDLAKHIEDTIYKSPGIEEGLRLAAPDRARDLLAAAANAPTKAQSNAYRKLADELGGIKDVKSLRTAQKDFVNLSKIDEATARATAGAGAQLGDNMQGLGKVVQRPTNLLAMPLNAATPAAGGLMARAGRALQGTGRSAGQGPIGRIMSNPAAQFLLPQAAVRGAADILGIRGGAETAGAAAGLPGAEDAAMAGLDPASAAALLGGQPSTPSSIYSREAAAQDIQNDLAATGGENMEKYLKLFEFLNPQGEAGGKPLSAEASKVIANANSGLQSLSQLSQQIQEGGVPLGTVLPGRDMLGGLGASILGTSQYDTTARNIADVITRLRTGAALTESEERFYKSQLPQAFDPPEVQQQKLQMFQDLFSSVANRTGTAGTDAGAILGL